MEEKGFERQEMDQRFRDVLVALMRKEPRSGLGVREAVLVPAGQELAQEEAEEEPIVRMQSV